MRNNSISLLALSELNVPFVSNELVLLTYELRVLGTATSDVRFYVDGNGSGNFDAARSGWKEVSSDVDMVSLQGNKNYDLINATTHLCSGGRRGVGPHRARWLLRPGRLPHGLNEEVVEALDDPRPHCSPRNRQGR